MKTTTTKAILLMLMLGFGVARNVSAGTYAKINIDGSFSDWQGVPVVATALAGTSGTSLDLASLSIANDESNIYLLVTYNSPVNPNAGPSVFLAFDTDNHPGTGFSVYSLGLVGSEAAWQNDFPFAQSNGVFNAGGITGGAALIAPFFSVTTTQEYAIARSATYTANGQPVFPGNTFTLMVYADPTPNTDLLGPVQYTCATNTPTGTDPGVAVLDHHFVGGVAVRRLVFDDVHAPGLRVAHHQIQLQRQVDIGDVVPHTGSDEDPRSPGQVDDVELHGAAGAEPPGGNHVDLVGRRLTGHSEVTLAVATTRDTRLPLIEQLRRGFAGPDPWGPAVVHLVGLLGQHGLVNQSENLHTYPPFSVPVIGSRGCRVPLHGIDG